MTEDDASVLSARKKRTAGELELLQQNLLLSEREFISFYRERGLSASGAPEDRTGDICKRCWLTADGTDYDGGPLLHPFRIYPLWRILQAEYSGTLQHALNGQQLADQWITTDSRSWNGVVDLAILLEPIYWPRITGLLSLGGGMDDQQHRARLEGYSRDALHFVKQLDCEKWRRMHESLRRDAAGIDDNTDLYVLLRVSTWESRTRTRGRISGALWLRHIAEVIRRAFEDAHATQWLEEDQAIGRWVPGGRTSAFGSERPFDDEFRCKPYVAYRFGLFTGSAVRWYVEGDTEYYFVDDMLPDAARVAIELVNLKGAVAAGRGNAAQKLGDMLRQDRALRRFSIIWFDLDDRANEKAVRQLVKEDCVIGSVAANRPDFEFANFTVNELAEVAARIDEVHGFSGAGLRTADWTGVDGGKAFEDRYLKISARKPGALKNEEWGRALAAYAREHTRRSDGKDRPLWNDISAALYSWNSNYNFHRAHFILDSNSFERLPRPEIGP